MKKVFFIFSYYFLFNVIALVQKLIFIYNLEIQLEKNLANNKYHIKIFTLNNVLHNKEYLYFTSLQKDNDFFTNILNKGFI